MFNINLEPTRDDKFILKESYTYKGFTIPKGYKTNGADVPLVSYTYNPSLFTEQHSNGSNA